MKFLFAITFGLCLSVSVQAQSAIDTSLIVNGVCGMCESTIEKAAKLDGVEKAEWDKDTKILKLTYQQDRVDLSKIYHSVAASGYDTEYLAAPDSAYQALQSCCMYRDPQTHKDHEEKK